MAPEPLGAHEDAGPLRTHGTYLETQDPGQDPAAQGPVSLPARFDLSAEVREDRTVLRGALRRRWALAFVSLGLAVSLLGAGLVVGNLLLLLPGAFLLAGAIMLLRVVVSIDRWPTAIELDSLGIKFEFSPRRTPMILWRDPKFELVLRETPAEVNRAAQPPKDAPSYRLYTGQSRRASRLPRIVVSVPTDLVRAILATARARQLSIDRELEGAVGTGSERLVYRIEAPRRAPAQLPSTPFPSPAQK
jgi:hypothetical protein